MIKNNEEADERNFLSRCQFLREGGRGFGILVSSTPKESNAFYSLRDPSEVGVIHLFNTFVTEQCVSGKLLRVKPTNAISREIISCVDFHSRR